MKGYVCDVCKYIPIDGVVPEKCPACGSPKTVFKEQAEAIKIPKDINNLSELEKKHIPVINLVKKCGLIPEGCQDAQIKIGQVLHPMLSEHLIQRIDFYIDKKYISRVIFTADKLNPAVILHLKPGPGTLTAIALCNLHGAWIKEVDL